jgi:hypothetical protein
VSAITSGLGDIRAAAKGWMDLALFAASRLGTPTLGPLDRRLQS